MCLEGGARCRARLCGPFESQHLCLLAALEQTYFPLVGHQLQSHLLLISLPFLLTVPAADGEAHDGVLGP